MSENKFYNKPEYLVEEAKNTIKIGRRRAIDSINLIDGFFQEGRQDQSEIRDGIYQLCQGIELIIKGLIKFYGEETVEILDKVIVTPPASQETPKNEVPKSDTPENNAPKTGDTNNIALYTILGFTSLSGAIVLLKKSRTKTKNCN